MADLGVGQLQALPLAGDGSPHPLAVPGEQCDITAERDGRALTFGAGPHFCLGSNLARAELEEAITFLAPRMAELRPAAAAELGGVEGIYQVESLPLTWSPA